MAVYFVQAGEGGPIKIGFTGGNVSERIADIQTGCPFPLIALGTIDGGEAEERELHLRFRDKRLSGEWFTPCDELLTLTASAAPLPRKATTKAAQFIESLGGNRAVAAICSVGVTAVSNWRSRGAIPPRLYLKIKAAADRLGIDAPSEVFFELRGRP